MPFHSQTSSLRSRVTPGRLVHDRLARRGQPVDERRLADVREADDRDRPEEPGCWTSGVSVVSLMRRGRVPRPAELVHLDEEVARARGSAARSPRRPRDSPCPPRQALEAHGSPHATETGCEVAGLHSCEPWIAAGTTGTSSCSATIAAPGCTCPGHAAPLARALDEEAERVAVADDLAHQPDRLAVGLAAAHGDRPEAADQLAEPRDAVGLDLGHVVDRPRRQHAERGGSIQEKWLNARTTPPVARHPLGAVVRAAASAAGRAVPIVYAADRPDGVGARSCAPALRDDELLDPRDDVVDRELGRVDLIGVLGRPHRAASLSSRSAQVGGERVGADLRPLDRAAARAHAAVGDEVDLDLARRARRPCRCRGPR